MIFMPWETWLRLFVWLAIGFAIYYFYGKKNSVLRKRLEKEKINDQKH
nr:amino acid permease C-terminal domain-containing protein [Pedobacter namyangjuensis]